MAVHPNTVSMLQESLPEMVLTAKYCIEFRKKSPPWPAQGCYGYPAALILLSIADSIGSYVIGGNVKKHFQILNTKDYYNFALKDEEIDIIYNYYRNTLSHNTVLAPNTILDIGKTNDMFFEEVGIKYILRLVPLYNETIKAVNKLLSNTPIFSDNETIKDIEKKL